MSKKIILIIMVLIISGCNNITPSKINEENERKYYEVNSYLDKENDWVYYMNLVYDTNNKIKYYNFNGINKKIDSIDNLYMPVRENGKIVEKWEPICICLNYYQTYKEEFDRINDFFNQKKFQSKISINDLRDLETDYYSKEDLVYLFNNALEKNYKRPLGNFKYIKNNIWREDKNGKWTIVAEGSGQYIEIIYIDFKFKDGRYLSELVYENEIYKEKYLIIKKIEEYILQNQEVDDLSGKFVDIEENEYKVLFELISKIDDPM